MVKIKKRKLKALFITIFVILTIVVLFYFFFGSFDFSLGEFIPSTKGYGAPTLVTSYGGMNVPYDNAYHGGFSNSRDPSIYGWDITFSGDCRPSYGDTPNKFNYYITKNGKILGAEEGVITTGNPKGIIYYLYDDKISNVLEEGRTVLKYQPCYSWQNAEQQISTYEFIFSSDKFNITILPLKSQFFTGESINIEVNVENKFDDVTSNICAVVETETIFGIQNKEYCSGIKELLGKGIHTFTVNIPVKEIPTQEVNIFPKVKIYARVEKLLRVHGISDSDYNPNTLNDLRYFSGGESPNPTSILLGTFEGDKQTIIINPKPLYIEIPSTGCPIGYILSENKNYCLRDDIKTLSCFQIGCPTFEDTNIQYSCTSAGICAQEVFVQKKCTSDEYCKNETGIIASKCDVQSGVCINDKVYNEIIQCNIAQDCLIPCQGVAVSCNQNKCEYLGECSIEQLGCKQLGCAEGYSCNTERNICERTITKTSKTFLYILIGMGLIILILIGIISFKLFKRK